MSWWRRRRRNRAPGAEEAERAIAEAAHLKDQIHEERQRSEAQLAAERRWFSVANGKIDHIARLIESELYRGGER